MALTACPECAHQMSGDATTCPQCGHRSGFTFGARASQGFLAVVALVVFLLLVLHMAKVL